MAKLHLAGCTPEPLMAYLKALGVFRVVAEQADPGARGHWGGGAFVLESRLDRDGLLKFLLNEYRPTAILAPWNGGSGFYGGKAEDALKAIEHSSPDRLAPYRAAVAAVRPLVSGDKPEDVEKEALLRRCRAELPDEVVPWLDTCYVLTEDGPGYFPLLGSGGNDGRLDFTSNFMQRLAEVIPFGPGQAPKASGPWLESALFAEGLPRLEGAAVGQFNPGGVGGANGVQGSFEADSRVNPWDYVLMIEGALLFAGSVARRLGSRGRSRASFPFTVEAVAVGYGSASTNEETSEGSRAELWLPLWGRAAGLPEVARLFAEGRAQLGRRQARNAIEFALAACLVGVGAGVDAFARYGFLKRNGLAYLAAPLGRVKVHQPPEALLLDDPALQNWLEGLRRACRDKGRTPARYQAALHGIDRALFAFAGGAQQDERANARALRDVLAALGQAERTLAKGLRFCDEKGVRPLQGLRLDWLRLADGAPQWREFRLAAALASVRAYKDLGPFRVHLEQVNVGKRADWKAGNLSAVWAARPPADNLAEVFLRRWVETERAGQLGVALRAHVPAALADVVAFLNKETDDELLDDLLWALIGLNWADMGGQAQGRDKEHRAEWYRQPAARLSRDFALLRLIAEPVGLSLSRGRWQGEKKNPTLRTRPEPRPFHLIARGAGSARERCDEAVDLAARRLWADRLTPFGWGNRRRRQARYAAAGELEQARLVAACLFPLSSSALGRLANRALNIPEEAK